MSTVHGVEVNADDVPVVGGIALALVVSSGKVTDENFRRAAGIARDAVQLIRSPSVGAERRPDDSRISEAADIALRYGQIDGAHHKLWVINQMLRVLLGGAYERTIRAARAGVDGPDTFPWDEGIAP